MKTAARLSWWTLALAGVLVVGLALRLHHLAPPERGLLYAADADEGIYAASARLALDGFRPYRDYFCSAPPLALYLFMAVLAPTSPPWGNATGFMALRYASVVYGLATLAVVYATGRRLGGQPAGLLAAGLLAIDGWAVAQDRRAMLEAPMNLLSGLSMLALVVAIKRSSGRWFVAAGVCAGLAIAAKTQGMVILLVVVLTLGLQRRWRHLLLAAIGATVAYGVIALPYLLTAADDMVRQLFFFQFLRPPNGDPGLMLRVNAIRNYPESWLSVRLGLLGGALVLLRLLWSAATPFVARLWSAATPVVAKTPHLPTTSWLPIILWALAVAASFAASKTFYLYYYAQLAPPLALLGGSLLHDISTGLRTQDARVRLAHVGVVAVLAALALWRLPAQMAATVEGTNWVKTAYAAIGQHIAANTPAATRVMVFEPNYTFLATRPPARVANGAFFLDSHAYMLYVNLNIKTSSYGALLRQIAQRTIQDEQALLWQRPAQNLITLARDDYEFVVIDRRARYLLAPDTLAAIEQQTDAVAAVADTVLRKQR